MARKPKKYYTIIRRFGYRDGYNLTSEEWEVIGIHPDSLNAVKWDNYFYAWVEAQRRNQQEKAR